MNELKLKWDDSVGLGLWRATFLDLEIDVELDDGSFDWNISRDNWVLVEAENLLDTLSSAQLAAEAELQRRLQLCAETLDSSWLEDSALDDTVKQIGYTINESSFDLTAAYRLIRENGLSGAHKEINWRKGFDEVMFASREEPLKAATEIPVPPMRGPFFSVLATNSANQEQADQAQKVINHMVEEAMRTGDFSELEELPGLKENVERLIEEHLERQRPLEGKPACKYCGRLTPLVDGECKKCVEVMSSRPGGPTGYGQILAQIKREASEVEL